MLPGGSRRPFAGEPGQVAEDIQTYTAFGVSELIVDFRRESLSETLERMGSVPATCSHERDFRLDAPAADTGQARPWSSARAATRRSPSASGTAAAQSSDIARKPWAPSLA